MSDDKPSTMEQLRRLIGSDGETNSATPTPPAPAASPLGTDDEAGGTTPTAERIEMAQRAEGLIQEAAARKVASDKQSAS